MKTKFDPARAAEFVAKLEALLVEYDASISWTCDECSDMHGIYDDAIDVEIGDRVVLRSDSGILYAGNFKDAIVKGN